MSEFETALAISAAGMRAQSARMRVVAENMANVNSTGDAPGEDPYRRRMPVFKAALDQEIGARLVEVKRVKADMSDFGLRYEPEHPAADEKGYVKTPNVNSLIEMMDMQEAQRSYEANLNVLDATRKMAARTLDLLK